jgi:hypothetical protein
MEKLCCSSKTFLTMTTGAIELSELVIPNYTARHVQDHLESMGILAKAVEAIPGAERIKITPYQREKSTPVFRLAMIVGAMAAIIAVFVVKPSTGQPELSALASTEVHAEGMLPIDYSAVPDQQGFRVAKEDDFNPQVAGYIKSFGDEVTGRVTLNFASDETTPDVAYWLTDGASKNRLVLIKQGVSAYDTVYGNLVGMAKVSKDNISRIHWTSKPTREITGDAVILFLRQPDGDIGSLVLFPMDGKVVTGAPERYDQVNLE